MEIYKYGRHICFFNVVIVVDGGKAELFHLREKQKTLPTYSFKIDES